MTIQDMKDTIGNAVETIVGVSVKYDVASVTPHQLIVDTLNGLTQLEYVAEFENIKNAAYASDKTARTSAKSTKKGTTQSIKNLFSWFKRCADEHGVEGVPVNHSGIHTECKAIVAAERKADVAKAEKEEQEQVKKQQRKVDDIAASLGEHAVNMDSVTVALESIFGITPRQLVAMHYLAPDETKATAEDVAAALGEGEGEGATGTDG